MPKLDHIELPVRDWQESRNWYRDHLGFEEANRAWLGSRGAMAISVGPRSVHAEDAITVVLNEIDRRDGRRRLITPIS